MIQFALLFGLGFLSAALVALLLAPAIHRRIVRYTENRIRATMPISPQEVRAQRDMARAVYAAENARTKQELVRERDRNTDFQLRLDALLSDLKRLEGEKLELKMRIDEFDVAAAEARARLREEDSYIQELKAALSKAEEAEAESASQTYELRQQLFRLTSDADNFRIDLSTRDTEMENLRLRMTTLRDERENLRTELRQQTTRAKDAETKLAQEEERVARLDDRLNREIADRSDKEVALERRLQEIARLRERLGISAASPVESGIDAGRPDTALPVATPARDEDEDVAVDNDIVPVAQPVPPAVKPQAAVIGDDEVDARIASLAEDARNRATALSERLLNSKSTANDEALRQELAVIAASMVALTAASEGKASPIHPILSGRTGSSGRESLAVKAKKTLSALNGEPI
ncbi:hypothetical protein EPK99_10100 [Neorhizobium lilium]|uniref:Uncharacterized protein n=1 Tax=Neorhizobium lilium TaxID=2503024 RepID=A0A444LIU9_9HYPH|nr:hypothetical protein [Neorhizobium lilium]RWX78919.1 hypothetical protein EPK99_10100 [Neorhizobium lilium]